MKRRILTVISCILLLALSACAPGAVPEIPAAPTASATPARTETASPTVIPEPTDGLHENSILTCLKHYPGHGDTVEDTHTGTVVLEKTWSELQARELVPYKKVLAKTDCVMAAHITLPQVDASGTPASLSHVLI